MSTSLFAAKTQAQTENMKTFLDSKLPGIAIQVNATAETQPNQNINISISLKRQTTVYVEYFNIRVYGFVNGTQKALMWNLSDINFPLTETPQTYNDTFDVQENVWDVAYGEVTISYNATYVGDFGSLEIPYRNITLGFTMTHVENVYLKSLREQLEDLHALLEQFNETFLMSFDMNLTLDNLIELNRTYWEIWQNYTELQQNYDALRGGIAELEGTRRALAILVIIAVFFVASTLYLFIRRPKEQW